MVDPRSIYLRQHVKAQVACDRTLAARHDEPTKINRAGINRKEMKLGAPTFVLACSFGHRMIGLNEIELGIGARSGASAKGGPE
jgi:hypothetical protein